MDKLLYCAIFCSIVSLSEPHSILAVFPYVLKSHMILGDAFVDTLLEAGHKVTYITAYPKKQQHHPNLTEVDVSENLALLRPKSLADIIEQKSNYNNKYNVLRYVTNVALSTAASGGVRRLLSDTRQHFDLVVAEWMFSELYAGFSFVYDCPLIWVSTTEPHWMVKRLVELTWNTEFHPNFGTKNVQPFSFQQRLTEFMEQLETSAMNTFFFHGIQSQYYHDYFVPFLNTRGLAIPQFEELSSSTSLLMMNSRVPLAQVSPLTPNCIEIGGYHINEAVEPLSEHLQQMMDEATHGVIYFSMGSNLSGAMWPEEVVRNLIILFGALNQTVLWKLDYVPSDLPANVHILHWAPQQAILKHPHCSLFITHGGLLSVTEAVHFGVPIIGVPFFGDQYANAERKGFGKTIVISRNLHEDLKAAIEEIMNNSTYKENVQQLSLMFHDRIPPRRRLLAWVDYVIRTRGAAHLRSPAFMVPWYQQWYLDIIGLILAAALPLLIALIFCWRRKCCLCL